MPVAGGAAFAFGGRNPPLLSMTAASGLLRKSRNAAAAAWFSLFEEIMYDTLKPVPTALLLSEFGGKTVNPTLSPIVSPIAAASQLPSTRKSPSPFANATAESASVVPLADSGKY